MIPLALLAECLLIKGAPVGAMQRHETQRITTEHSANAAGAAAKWDHQTCCHFAASSYEAAVAVKGALGGFAGVLLVGKPQLLLRVNNIPLLCPPAAAAAAAGAGCVELGAEDMTEAPLKGACLRVIATQSSGCAAPKPQTETEMGTGWACLEGCYSLRLTAQLIRGRA